MTVVCMNGQFTCDAIGEHLPEERRKDFRDPSNRAENNRYRLQRLELYTHVAEEVRTRTDLRGAIFAGQSFMDIVTNFESEMDQVEKSC